jgi:uncharacterized protein (DUF3084 family)
MAAAAASSGGADELAEMRQQLQTMTQLAESMKADRQKLQARCAQLKTRTEELEREQGEVTGACVARQRRILMLCVLVRYAL